MTKEKIKELAYRLYAYLVDHQLAGDTRIYFGFSKTKNGYALQSYKPNNVTYTYTKIKVGTKEYPVYLISDINPNDYFDYNGNYISVSTEGPLYDVLNYGYDKKTETDLRNMFEEYGLYYELGNAWNFSLYEV